MQHVGDVRLQSMGSRSRTRLSDFTFTFHLHALQKEMATHSSVLAWRIPGTGEPGGLPSMGSHRVGHDWSDLAAAAAGDVTISLSVRTDQADKPEGCRRLQWQGAAHSAGRNADWQKENSCLAVVTEASDSPARSWAVSLGFSQLETRGAQSSGFSINKSLTDKSPRS